LYLRYIQQPLKIRRLRARQINKMLLLCYGNICLSPLAGKLARKRFPNVSFSSSEFYTKTRRPSPDFLLVAVEMLELI
jgi:protein-tyrosine-phosphatase